MKSKDFMTKTKIPAQYFETYFSTGKVIMCVKNEGTDISDPMGVFQMKWIIFVWEVRIPKIAFFYYKFRQKPTTVTALYCCQNNGNPQGSQRWRDGGDPSSHNLKKWAVPP